MKTLNFNLKRVIVLCLLFGLTACMSFPPIYPSKVVEPPTEKIGSLIIWYKQGAEVDDSQVDDIIPKLVVALEKKLRERNIVVKSITTGKLSLTTPENELSQFVKTENITNVLKVEMASVSKSTYTSSSGGDTFTNFEIKAQLINSVNNHTLWWSSYSDMIVQNLISRFIDSLFIRGAESPESIASNFVKSLEDGHFLN